jgi:hypothetical protein
MQGLFLGHADLIWVTRTSAGACPPIAGPPPLTLGADGSVVACLSASKSKGDLTLPFFEHQDVDLIRVSLLDLATDKFRFSSRR